MLDHLLRRKVRTPLGVQPIDLREVVRWAEAHGVRFVLTSIVRQETSNGLIEAAYDLFGERWRPYELKRLTDRAARDWATLDESVEAVNPPVAPGAVPAARQFFANHPRDLAAFSIRDKDPVPDTNDIRILLQIASLGAKGHLITRDGHFLGYGDLIASRWRVNIHDGRRLPLLLEAWRGP